MIPLIDIINDKNIKYRESIVKYLQNMMNNSQR